MRALRSLAAGLTVLGAGGLVGLAVPASAEPSPYSWGGVSTWPTNRTVGTAAYDSGIWSYTNRWGKATGANVDGKHREDYFAGLPEADTLTYDAFGVHRTARNGDYYPPNDDARFPELSANVVFVQFHPSAAGLDVRVVLTSLGAPDSSILTLGLSTGTGTGTSTLPRGAGLTCTGCGVERYATVWGTGSSVTGPAGSALGTVQDLAVDRPENTITFRVPGVGSAGASLHAWLASGLNDGTGHYLTVQPTQSTTSPGGGTGTSTNVFDLAFVQADRRTIDERVQADLLAKGELAPARAAVDLAALRSGARRVKGEPVSGPVEKVLVSASNQGEGIDSGNGAGTFQNPGAGQNFHYLGRTQGYLVDLPPGWRPGVAAPEVMVLHGYNGYYDEEYFLAPKLRATIEKLGYIGVYPLGRGDVQYEHDGELDLLEVQRAVERDYRIDTDRVHVVGVSMGGFGTTKAVVRHPDVFADGSVFVGGEQGDANVVNDHLAADPLTRAADPATVGNLQDSPMLFGASTADADAGGASASVLYAQLRQLGDEVRLKQYLAGTHEPAIIDLAVPQMVAQWQRSTRPAVPARVRYALDTSWDFGPLTHTGSAWLQGLRPAAGTQASGEAEALTLPRTLTALRETASSGGSVTDRSAYLLRVSARHVRGTRPVSNALTVSLHNATTSSVDLAALKVDTGRRYCIDVRSDTASTLRLTGLAFVSLELTGVPSTRAAQGVVLQLPAGTSHAVLHPQAMAATVGSPCPAAGAVTATSGQPAAGAGGRPAAGAAGSVPDNGAPPRAAVGSAALGGQLARTGSGAATVCLAGILLLAALVGLRLRRQH